MIPLDFATAIFEHKQDVHKDLMKAIEGRLTIDEQAIEHFLSLVCAYIMFIDTDLKPLDYRISTYFADDTLYLTYELKDKDSDIMSFSLRLLRKQWDYYPYLKTSCFTGDKT